MADTSNVFRKFIKNLSDTFSSTWNDSFENFPWNETPRSSTDTETIFSEEVENAVKDLLNRKIILHNDDHNSFDHVIACLMEYCEHSSLQAEQCALIVHYNGKAEIKRGSFEDLKPICEALLENGLSAEIQ